MRGPIEARHHAVLALAFRRASSFSIMATRISNSSTGLISLSAEVRKTLHFFPGDRNVLGFFLRIW
jgi:hypothetical protein